MNLASGVSIAAVIGSGLAWTSPFWSGSRSEDHLAVVRVLERQLDRCGPENLTCPPPTDSCSATTLTTVGLGGFVFGIALSITVCALWTWQQIRHVAPRTENEAVRGRPISPAREGLVRRRFRELNSSPGSSGSEDRPGTTQAWSVDSLKQLGYY